MTDFPLLRETMAERKLAFDAAYGLGRQPGRDRPLQERLEWRQKHDAKEAAYQKVCDAYASELLPAIRGGEWAKTDRSLFVKSPGGFAWAFIAGSCHALFDHPLHFRRRGAKGPLTWKNCVVIGQPYDPDDRERDEMAQQLAEHFGIGVWIRSDLSAWFPGATVLVIAALGLLPQNAEKFGFTPLGRPQIPKQIPANPRLCPNNPLISLN